MSDLPQFTQAERDMMEGYWDGRDDERIEFPEQSNRSPAYRHGWLNGRDDRLHKPRDTAENLRRQADLILHEVN
jgi:hypothetical protein